MASHHNPTALILAFAFLYSPTVYSDNIAGNVYSSDITAYVDGSPIRSYSLNGKTAIAVEDLCRYGFEVSYVNEYRTLYANVRPNTYPHSPEEITDCGNVGDILGQIYFSDIKTVINGVTVPSYAFNGQTIAAIEDIAANASEGARSDTIMTYTWNAADRTIELNPVYDNSLKLREIFGSKSVMAEIEDGELICTSGIDAQSVNGINAVFPDGAYDFPVVWQGETVGSAYESALLLYDGEKLRRSQRYIINFDTEKLSELIKDENFTNLSLEELTERETQRLLSVGNVEKHEGADGIILTAGADATIIHKNTDAQYVAARCRRLYFSGIFDDYAIPEPKVPDLTLIAANADDNGITSEFIDKNGGAFLERSYYASVGFCAAPKFIATSLGYVYIFKPSLSLYDSSAIAVNYIDIEVDGQEVKNVHALTDTETGTVYFSAQTAAAFLGGSAEYKNRCVYFTTDAEKHSLKVTGTLPTHGDPKAIYPMSGDFTDINAVYVDGERVSVTEEMYVYDGEIYVPAETVINGQE